MFGMLSKKEANKSWVYWLVFVFSLKMFDTEKKACTSISPSLCPNALPADVGHLEVVPATWIVFIKLEMREVGKVTSASLYVAESIVDR